MPDLAMLDYFYGDEAEQFTFYRIPKVLFTDPSYRRISSDAKILYGLMLDRMGLSVRNGWLDEYNRVFIFFTLEDALEYLCCGHFQPDVLKQEFNLPANLEPVNILVVGYSDEEDADTNRFDSQRIPMSQLVSYENL